MKNLVLIVLVLLNVNAFSQTLYSERFGGLTLQSYTATNGTGIFTATPSSYNVLNDGHNNNVGTFVNPNTPFNYLGLKTSGWVVGYNAIEKDTFLISTSWLDTNAINCDRWVITPPITVTVANTVLKWSAKSPDANYRDGYEVYTTTVISNPSKTDFTLGNRIFLISDNNTAGAGENSEWTSRSVLLDQYIGQTVRFAFRNNSKDRFQLWIDDIEVKLVASVRDVSATKINIKKYILSGQSDTVGVTFTNLGASPVTTLVLNYTYGNSAVNTQTFNSALGWGYSSVNQATFALPFSFSSPGIYEVKAWPSSVNGLSDQLHFNDTAKIFVTVQNTNVQRTVLLEQFVSANDGDSPDAQEKALGVASSSVIVVNVHDNDSLKTSTIASLITDYKKSSSTALIDRSYFASLNKISLLKSQYYNGAVDRVNAVSPASVSIINKTYNTSTKQLVFTVKADFVGEVKGDYRMNAYLVENNVYSKMTDTSWNGFNQLNDYYSVPWSPYYLKGYFSSVANSYVLNYWQFKHQNVLIHAYDGAYGLPGTIPTTGGTAGNSYSQSYTITIPTLTTGVAKYNPDNIYIVGFVAEAGTTVNDRTILNATKDKLTANPEMIGIEETIFETVNFSMFPNPNNGEFFIKLSDKQLNKDLVLTVKDILGRAVYSSKLYSTTNLNEIDIKHLANGAYLLEIEQNGQKSSCKLIVQH